MRASATPPGAVAGRQTHATGSINAAKCPGALSQIYHNAHLRQPVQNRDRQDEDKLHKP